MSYSSIHNIRGVLRPAFQLAVDDDLIMKNPFGFEMGTVIQNDSKKLQYLMGHSDIAVTLNVYTHMGLDDARKELEK